MSDQQTLSELLDDEFRRLAQQTGQEHRATNARQAGWLEVSASQLSRIRRGEANLSREKAIEFAGKLRSDEVDRAKLTAKMLDAFDRAKSASTSSDSPTDAEVLGPLVSLRNVGDLFDRLGTRGSLLCVEYRDNPRATRGQKYPKYGELAGAAIAKGLSFAMFQPFGLFSSDDQVKKAGTANGGTAQKKQLHTETVRSYLKHLQHEVRLVHGAMLDAAIHAAEINGMDKAKARREIPARLILYERRSHEFVGSGIQSRLFYAELNKEWSVEREVWEWIAAAYGPDLFIRRDVPETVIADQFFPIVSFWRDEKRLPTTDVELASAIKKYAKEAEAKLQICPWKVYQRRKNDH